MAVPPTEVAMTMLNTREITAPVNPDDQVIVIPSDVAGLWRHLGWMTWRASATLERARAEQVLEGHD
jgi:hypothetical protein